MNFSLSTQRKIVAHFELGDRVSMPLFVIPQLDCGIHTQRYEHMDSAVKPRSDNEICCLNSKSSIEEKFGFGRLSLY